MRAWSRGKLTIFQSTLSVRRATWRPLTMEQSEAISIHALRKESDAYCGRIMSPCSAFQSTLSVRRATFTPTLDLAVSIFQSTLSVRRATHDGHSTVGGSIFQSTLSVRRATPEHPEGHARNMISIHALRKESDRLWNHHASHHQRFQSTLSVRRATGSPYFAIVQFVFQSTLSVRRATRLMLMAWLRLDISIHALRKESDCPPLPHCSWGYNFNPRSP